MEPRRKLILYIIVSFILGGVGGWFVGSTYAPRHEWQQRREGGSPMKEFAERLKLDETQTAMVDSILESHRSVFDSLRKEYGKSYRAGRDTIRQQIKAILSPEQQKLYDEFIQQMEEREAKRRSGGSTPDRRSR